ncbi:neural cell adhesion molecule 1-B-like [Watersipora subatra]|uniref:neural cell adhesion molecule 1-B-like n=1 Tax=Watersipora subatra TaxID=2589382 RepID=UPI00355B259C
MNRPNKIVEGKEFTFNCTSTGGSPDSVYDYEVLREDVVIVSSNSYTPVKEDRDGLTLRCKDTTHSVLENIYPDNIIISEDVEPHYIDYKEGPHYGLEYNPGGPLTLTCKVLTDSNSNLTFKWSCSTCSGTDASDQLVISMDSRQNGQTEQFNYTASIEFVGEITITWNVTWTDAVTIPPTTQPTTTTKSTVPAGLGIGAIVGIAIGGVVLIVVVIIIIYFCRKNKVAASKAPVQGGKGDPVSTTEKNQSGRKSKSTHKNEKNQNSQSNTNNPVPAVKYADDSIVYAVLEHDNNPARVAKVKPTKPQQPPEDALPYMSIDFNATEALKQRRNGDDNLYENCNDEPTTSSTRPTTSAARPPTSAARPPTSSARPTTSSARPTTPAARPTTSSARPTTRVPLPPRPDNV